MSVLVGAAAVLLVYLSVVRLLRIWMDTEEAGGRIAVLTGGGIAALCTAFSTSFWFNATEAEVYALSMFFTVLAFWLVLRWGEEHTDRRDRLLLLTAYLFGLGAGVHLQCLLTLPGILVLVFADLMVGRSLKDQVLIVMGLTLYPFLAIFLPTELTALMTLAILVGLALLRPGWRNPWFWGCGILLAGLGYSTYLALMIRSGLNPVMDMNNPETWENLKAVLNREQYGRHTIFPRRGDFWAYQLNIYMKYFLQQFPHGFNFTDTFRRAVDTFQSKYEIVVYSLIPLLFGIGGAVYHLFRDWKRFAAVFAMFSLMGIGLVLYLNMPDPEPREREYIFVGAYTFFSFWIGIGAAGLVAWIWQRTASVALARVFALLTLLLPAGILAKNLTSHDRTGDTIAQDYAYNILQTCEEDSILFTNGDNDTYPIWYLQYVKGIRKDVRVVNLSLIKTPWYVKQLRDLEPSIPIGLNDRQIDREVKARLWREPRDLDVAGIAVKADEVPSAQYFAGDTDRRVPVVEPHTILVWWIVRQVNWERSIYFARTVPDYNMAGLWPYLSVEGMASRLVKERAPGQLDVGRTARNLFEVYRYGGIADEAVYKDPVARRQITNYAITFAHLVQAYFQLKRYDEAFQTLQRAEQTVPPHAVGQENGDVWVSTAGIYGLLAKRFSKAGQLDKAAACLEGLIRIRPDVENRQDLEALIRAWRS